MEEKEDSIITDYKKYLSKPIRQGMVVHVEKPLFYAEDDSHKIFEIQAVNWHFQALAMEIVEEALPNLNIAKLDEEHKKIVAKNGKMKGIDGTKKALCYHYNFVEEIVANGYKLAKDKTMWKDFVEKKRIGQLVKVNSFDAFEVPTIKWLDIVCNSKDECEKIVEELSSSEQKLSIIHAENLARATRKSEQFRHFLCSKDTDDLQIIVKPRIEKLVGTLELMRLEDQFPEHLRIDLMGQSTILECLRHILSLNFHKRKSVFLRTTTAQMIGVLHEKEKQFKKQLSKRGANANLQKTFEQKVAAILADAFSDLHSSKTICVMIKFVQFVQQSKKEKLETELKRWKAKKCEEEEQQHKTLDDYLMKELGKAYRDAILALLQGQQGAKQRKRADKMGEIMRRRGAKTMLLQIIGPKLFNELEEKSGNMLEGIIPSNSFLNEEILWEHYETTLLNKSALGLRSKMQADVITFCRWLHRQLVGERNMQILWDRMNKLFDLEHDALFVGLEEQNWDAMETILKLGRIFTETKQFMDDEILGKKLVQSSNYEQEMLKSKWEKAISQKGDEKSGEKATKMERWNKFLNKIHQAEIFGLMGRHEHIMDKFREFYTEEIFSRFSLFVKISEFINEWETLYGMGEHKKNAKRNKTGKIGKTEKSESEMEIEEEKIAKSNNSKGRQKEKNQNFGCPDRKTPSELSPFNEENFILKADQSLASDFIEFFQVKNDKVQIIMNKIGQCFSIELSTILWALTNFLQQMEKEMEKGFTNKSKSVQICVAYHLIEYTVKSEAKALDQWRQSLLYEEFIDENDQIFSMDRIDLSQWLQQKCASDAASVHVVSRLCSNRAKVAEFTAYAFRESLKMSRQLRGHFCNLKMPTDEKGRFEINESKQIEFIGGMSEIEIAKNKLLILVGRLHFIRFEEEFPEVLRIDAMLSITQPILYTYLFPLNSHTETAKAAESRIGIPFIIRHINSYLAAKNKEPSDDAKVNKAFARKAQEIFTESYKGLAKRGTFLGGDGMGRTVCILMAFKRLIEGILPLCMADKNCSNLEQLKKWSANKNCATDEWKMNAFNEQRNFMASIHLEMLRRYIGEQSEFAEFIRKTPGAKIRMRKLLVKEANYEELMESFSATVQNDEVFTDNWLVNSYLEFLNNFEACNAEMKLVHTLALSYAVWVRWMDAETAPENPRLSIGMREIYEQIWTSKRSYYQQKVYDALFDEPMEVLFFELVEIGEVFEKLRNFVELKRNEKNWDQLGITKVSRGRNGQLLSERKRGKGGSNGKLLKEWDEIVENINLRMKKDGIMEKPFEKEQIQLTEWIQNLHFIALNALIGQQKSMREKLRNELKCRQEIVEKWLTQFMEWSMAEKVISQLKLNEEQFTIMRENEKKMQKEAEILEEKERKIEEEKRKKELEEWDEKEKKAKKINEKAKKEKQKQNTAKIGNQKKQKEAEEKKSDGKSEKIMEDSTKLKQSSSSNSMNSTDETNNGKSEKKKTRITSNSIGNGQNQINGQMHRNNLAKVIGKGIGKMAEIWGKLDNERRTNLLTILCGKEDVSLKKTKHSLESQFALDKILLENEYEHTEKPNEALAALKSIVSKWSRGEAVLLEIGSFMLGANTANLDVDVIFIVPEKATKKEEISKFFGTTKCDLAQRRMCADGSFYCHLCQNEKVGSLKKMPFAYVPLVGLEFDGIQFDVLFVSIPTSESLPKNGPLNRNEVMALIRKLAGQKEADEKMIKSLAAFISNEKIMALLGRKNMQKFRKFLTILKFWSKANFIYEPKLGFFNGISLATMATKVMLLYPNASIPFLLDKFFLTFALWDWPIPLRLEEYVPDELQTFSWTPKDEEQKRNSPLLMPIITPGCLEQNAMFNMNSSTFKIVQKSMRESLIKVRKIQNSNPSKNWGQLFPTANFTEKYDHFFAVCCIVANPIHLEQFCDFVDRRIRLQLLHFDQLTDEVSFSHIKTEGGSKFECPNSILMPSLAKNRHLSLHKAWLVGIELLEKKAPNGGEKERIKLNINAKLNEEFNQKILESYFKANGWHPAELISKYVDKSEVIHG
ncbi:hypothetical protein niasHS_007720 [Heterodera schachtii]|uniref:polynucleotide adenylyltransferase n=1 Tax=Heterodera schachtii TaxID=97005 RepID=A0ABD2JPG9_HETSC